MNFLFYLIFAISLCLLGISTVVSANFRGSSSKVLLIISTCNILAYVAVAILFISLFWVAKWWIPIVVLLVSWLISGLFSHYGMKGNGFVAIFCILLYTICLTILYFMRFA